jgi:TRAP-type C4-dicarboxylate transport system permease small subunit
MRAIGSLVSSLSAIIDRIITPLLVGLIIVLSVLLGAGVFYRYILNDSIYWSNEVARYLLVYITFLGATLAHRHGVHVRIDIILERLSAINKKRLDKLISLLFLLFWVVILVSSWKLLPMFMMQKTATLNIPFAYPFAAVPISALVWILYSIDDLLRSFKVER